MHQLGGSILCLLAQKELNFTMQLKKYFAVILGFSLMLLSSLSMAQTLSADEKAILEDAVLETQRAFVYSSTFAKYLGISIEKALTLSPGVYAIELEVKKEKFFPQGVAEKFFARPAFTDEEKRLIDKGVSAFQILYLPEKVPYAYYYDCYLNLYVDNSLAIAYPDNGDLGDRELSAQLDQEAFAPILAQQKPPKVWQPPKHPDFAVNYNYKVFIPNKAGFSMLPYSLYLKKSFYGMTYIRLGPDKHCQGLAQGLKNFPVQLWVEKAQGQDYQPTDNKPVSNLAKEDFYQFVIPKKILESTILVNALRYEQHHGTKIHHETK